MIDIYKYDDILASEALEHHMTEYTKFAIEAFFPNAVDGLMKVQRRILGAIQKSPFGVSKKINQWSGVVLETHPHGDSSINQAMARLMQPFRYQIPLLHDQGDCGTYNKPFGAAPRYLEASSTKFVQEVFLTYEKSALYYKLSDAGNEFEPEYYIPKIPMALHLSTIGIASAYKTTIFPRDINNICDVTLWYIDQVMAGKAEFLINNKFPKELCDKLIPCFAIRNNILNKEQLIEAYQQGEHTHQIAIEGDYSITQNVFSIHNLPYGTGFRKVADDFIMKLRKRDKTIRELIDAIEVFRDIGDGKMRMDFKIIFKKKYTPWQFLPILLSEFKLYKKTTSDPRFLVKDGHQQQLGPGQLLNLWYKERVRAILIKHNKEQDRAIKALYVKEAHLILRDNVDKTTDIFKGSANKHDVIENLQAAFDLSYFQAEKISELPLLTLVSEEREKIVSDIAELKLKIKAITDSTLSIPNIIKGEIEDVKKAYGNIEKQTRCPRYKGFVKVDGVNFIQLEDINSATKKYEFDNYEILFNPSAADVYRYRTTEYGKIESDHPVLFEKYFSNIGVFFSPVEASHTVVINRGESPTIFYVDGLYNAKQIDDDVEREFVLAGDKVTTITKSGIIKCIDVKSLPLRKSIQAFGNMTAITHLSNQVWERMAVFVSNSSESNKVRAYVVEGGSGKINLLINGENHFNIFPIVPEPVVFQPHVSIFNRIPNYHLHIPNLMEFFGSSKSTIIDLAKRSCKHDKNAKIIFLNLNK